MAWRTGIILNLHGCVTSSLRPLGRISASHILISLFPCVLRIAVDASWEANSSWRTVIIMNLAAAFGERLACHELHAVYVRRAVSSRIITTACAGYERYRYRLAPRSGYQFPYLHIQSCSCTTPGIASQILAGMEIFATVVKTKQDHRAPGRLRHRRQDQGRPPRVHSCFAVSGVLSSRLHIRQDRSLCPSRDSVRRCGHSLVVVLNAILKSRFTLLCSPLPARAPRFDIRAPLWTLRIDFAGAQPQKRHAHGANVGNRGFPLSCCFGFGAGDDMHEFAVS
jgi:hypothetical protein